MRITQAFRFEAAHRLPRVPETHKCHNLHGHTYRVELTYGGAVNEQTGFVIDFFDVETKFGPVLRALDHHYLNEIQGLENPTVENIAMWIYDRMESPRPYSVRVYENPDCWAEYTGGDS